MSDPTTPPKTPASPPEPDRHAHIRSFVLRQGRLSNAQQRNCETLMPVWGIPYAVGLLDYCSVFGRSAPTILEIGFGMGDSTATIALAHPENNYLALEVHTPGVGNLLKLIQEQNIPNIRIIQHDAVEVLRDMLSLNSLAGVHVFFPDPWPKKKQQKRRLLQGPLVKNLAEHLIPGGYLHSATDWEEYGQQMLDVYSAEPLLENTADGFAPKPEYRPLTKFEARGIRLGHGVWDVVFRKRA
ncbi:MAG TPA: tRNA (guanosine(46)-N7)-methyltransferase TrmB [Rhodocyclaceae bacterium]|nr:tRNA (guanosine(46)-N7)-methyltransferase TrmB [Rhodocyclaceae bacterium]